MKSKFMIFILVAASFAAGVYFISERLKRMEGEIARLNQSGQEKDAAIKILTGQALASQKELAIIKKELIGAKEELENTKMALEGVGKELGIANRELDIANKELQISNKILDIANKLLEAANKQLGGFDKGPDTVRQEPGELTPSPRLLKK